MELKRHDCTTACITEGQIELVSSAFGEQSLATGMAAFPKGEEVLWAETPLCSIVLGVPLP
jgi:hypothetical protein